MPTRQPEVPKGQGEMQRALRGGQETCALTHMEVGFYTETNLGDVNRLFKINPEKSCTESHGKKWLSEGQVCSYNLNTCFTETEK